MKNNELELKELNSLTESDIRVINEFWKTLFPQFEKDMDSPFNQFDKKSGKLFFFGSFIYIDEDGYYHEDPMVSSEYYVKGKKYTSLKDVLINKAIRHFDLLLLNFFENQIDDDNNEIPFSSRYEFAKRNKKYVEYEFEEEEYDDEKFDDENFDVEEGEDINE